MIDGARHRRVHQENVAELIAATEDAQAALARTQGLPDERLQLLFVCAHPAIERAARAPLMLQTVMGLDAAAGQIVEVRPNLDQDQPR